MRMRFPIWCLVLLCSLTVSVGRAANPCENDPTCCVVTNPSGTTAQSSGNLLWHVRNQIGVGYSQCAKIVLAVDHVDPLEESIFLMPGVQLIGTTSKNLPVTLSLTPTAKTADGCVVDVWNAPGVPENWQGAGASRLENVAIKTTTGSGVCVHSDNNVLKTITVTGPGAATAPDDTAGVRFTTGRTNLLDTAMLSKLDSGVLMDALAEGNRVINATATANQFGMRIVGDNFNAVRTSTITNNIANGMLITGSGNIVGFADGQYGAVTFVGNGACAVQVESESKNRITRNSMRQNTGRGICLENGGNGFYPAPKNLRSIAGNSGSEWALAMIVSTDAGITEYFQAESGTTLTNDREGDVFKGDISAFIAAEAAQYLPDRNNNGLRVVYDFVPFTTLSPNVVTVATATRTPPSANAAASTSEFSLPVAPGTNGIGAPPRVCLPLTWFQIALETLLEGSTPTGDLWALDTDGDGRSNGTEDFDRDCLVDDGESDPGKKDKPVPPPVNTCGVLPAEYCTDTDKDGVMDVQDNCVTVANPDQADTEDPDGDGVFQGDGIGEACEDQDNDGELDTADNCVALANPAQEDLDGDGAGDVCDPDDDSDGLSDIDESTQVGTDARDPDTDGDGACDGPGWGFGGGSAPTCCVRPDDNCPRTPNVDQRDTDEDTIGDVCDAAPKEFLGTSDSDGDGRSDQNDRCPMMADNGTDTDHDNRPDVCDSDDDNDGLADADESGSAQCVAGQYVKGTTPVVAHDQFCILLDPKNPDSDGDGLCDGAGPGFDDKCHGGDSCPFHYEAGRGLQLDSKDVVQHVDANHNGIGDICEASGTKPDSDHDGVLDTTDNCPGYRNPDQRNTDGDSYLLGTILGGDGTTMPIAGGDVCDPDDDNDVGTAAGTYDWEESAVPGLHSWEPDSDHYNGKGYDDYCDGVGLGYSATAATICQTRDNCPVLYNPDQKDADGNGRGDVCDALGLGDRDGDGVSDGDDNCPNAANADQADLDKDGIGDACDPDIDGDGVLNVVDNCRLVYNPDQTDGDRNGIGDACFGFDQSVSPAIGVPLDIEAVGGIAGFDNGGCSLLQTP